MIVYALDPRRKSKGDAIYEVHSNSDDMDIRKSDGLEERKCYTAERKIFPSISKLYATNQHRTILYCYCSVFHTISYSYKIQLVTAILV